VNQCHRRIRLAVLIVSITSLTACSLAPPEPGFMQDVGGIKIYSSTADLQAAFLKDRKADEHFCDSRPSDVADTASASIGLSSALVGQNEQITDGASRGAVTLGGRSPAVLITREVMYRTCEMIMNMNLNKTEALDLYIRSLDLVMAVSRTDTGTGSASMVSAPSLPDVQAAEPAITSASQPAKAPGDDKANNSPSSAADFLQELSDQ